MQRKTCFNYLLPKGEECGVAMLSRLTDIKALLTACNLKPIYGYISGFLVNYIKNVGEVTSYLQKRSVTMFATGKVTNERWTCAEEGFVLVTTTNLSATLREPSLSSER